MTEYIRQPSYGEVPRAEKEPQDTALAELESADTEHRLWESLAGYTAARTSALEQDIVFGKEQSVHCIPKRCYD